MCDCFCGKTAENLLMIAEITSSTVPCATVFAVSARRHLWSAVVGGLATARTRTVGFGPQCYSAAGPSAWNSLLAELKNTSLTFERFNCQLNVKLLCIGTAIIILIIRLR